MVLVRWRGNGSKLRVEQKCRWLADVVSQNLDGGSTEMGGWKLMILLEMSCCKSQFGQHGSWIGGMMRKGNQTETVLAESEGGRRCSVGTIAGLMKGVLRSDAVCENWDGRVLTMEEGWKLVDTVKKNKGSLQNGL
ncbi:unnamed protein product [Vicia faba]|uniref:Uncharacterized protein n=1 Tax=Vicia faba TaxID=3906 RepID=A0AAV0YZ92_VICFA|nr:unnamed protein product [Vicia faba]CAI8589515.1 unnamed protein product [Vicia faba]